MVNEVKSEVGSGKAIIALSGGIDSSVATAIAAKALGIDLLRSLLTMVSCGKTNRTM
jgi:GMP synthase (glutamine-hydrolyzing) (EC 6.3.5.2)